MSERAQIASCLQVIRSLDPSTGGPVSALDQMLSALAEKGIRVAVATTRDAAAAESRLRGATVYAWPRQFGKVWSFSIPLWHWLKNNIRSYDIVHITGVFTFPALAAAYWANRYRVPYVLRPAGTLDVFALQQKSWKKTLFVSVFGSRMLKRAAATQVTSTKEREGLLALGLETRAAIVPLAVTAPTGQKIPQNRSWLEVLFLARLHPVKALPVLVKATALARQGGADIRLTVAGQGSASYEQELRELVGSLNLNQVVTFVGFVEGASKAAMLWGADVFVLPSYQESFGIAVAEAMAYGLPVIVSDQVALADDVKKAGAGFVVPVGDAQAIAERLLELINPELRKSTGQRAYKLTRAEYSESEYGDRLLRLYEFALKSGPEGESGKDKA